MRNTRRLIESMRPVIVRCDTSYITLDTIGNDGPCQSPGICLEVAVAHMPVLPESFKVDHGVILPEVPKRDSLC